MARLFIVIAFTLVASTAEAQGNFSELISIIRAESPRQSDSARNKIAEILRPYSMRQKELAEADWKAIDSGLSDADPYVRDQTCAVLVTILYVNQARPIRMPDTTRDVVVQQFGESNSNLRGNALRVIAMNASGVPAALATQLRQMARLDNSSEVRGVAMATLASINPPDPETNEFWVQSLSNVSERNVRGMVLSAFRLNSPSDPRVIALVIDALKDSDRFVRQEAIAAIIRIGKPAESALPLLQQIRDTDADLRGNADAAIRVLTK
jgi:HEAT repeats